MIYIGVLVLTVFEALIPGISSLGCDKQAQFETHKGSRLLNSVLEQTYVRNIADCIYKCIEKKHLCQSINYHHGNSDVIQCYLNNRTRRSAQAEDFKSDPAFTYYEKDLCIPNPCLFQGKCSKNNSKKGFLCSCQPRYKGSICEIEPLGWSSRRPGRSCKDIKSSGDGLYDGKYWIDPENDGNPMPVYCDMSHEGGGWMLVCNVVLPNPVTVPTLTLSTSFRDIANYNDNKTVISATALRQTRQHLNFTQLRFHCRLEVVGRTVHIITVANSKGYGVLDYFTATTNTLPQACNSFYRGSDDNSLLAAQCDRWMNRKWSTTSRWNEWRLNDHSFYVPNKYHWFTKGTDLGCDSRTTSKTPGDYWKIYVR